MEFFTLFLSSFASATLLPVGSEALLLYLLSENLSAILLLIVATLGNTLGSFANYILGRYATNFCLRKGYMKEKHLSKATLLFEKYGAWSLLFSWLPIIGDPLTFVAGVVRYTWWKFLMIVCFAKLSRYVFVYLGFLAVTQ
ncbi:MAG: DedA family protein [Campylobacterales bacterium]|nr:DedA family protein [Campylobacterales bacterium]MBN2832809.1 DedA family protein [Campylobacterales bacterium]